MNKAVFTHCPSCKWYSSYNLPMCLNSKGCNYEVIESQNKSTTTNILNREELKGKK